MAKKKTSKKTLSDEDHMRLLMSKASRDQTETWPSLEATVNFYSDGCVAKLNATQQWRDDALTGDSRAEIKKFSTEIYTLRKLLVEINKLRHERFESSPADTAFIMQQSIKYREILSAIYETKSRIHQLVPKTDRENEVEGQVKLFMDKWVPWDV